MEPPSAGARFGQLAKKGDALWVGDASNQWKRVEFPTLPQNKIECGYLINAFLLCCGARRAMLLESVEFSGDIVEDVISGITTYLSGIAECYRIGANKHKDALFVHHGALGSSSVDGINKVSESLLAKARNRESEALGQLLEYACPGDTGASHYVHFYLYDISFHAEMLSSECFAANRHKVEERFRTYRAMFHLAGVDTSTLEIKWLRHLTEEDAEKILVQGKAEELESSQELLADRLGELFPFTGDRISECASVAALYRTDVPVWKALHVFSDNDPSMLFANTPEMAEFSEVVNAQSALMEHALYRMFGLLPFGELFVGVGRTLFDGHHIAQGELQRCMSAFGFMQTSTMLRDKTPQQFHDMIDEYLPVWRSLYVFGQYSILEPFYHLPIFDAVYSSGKVLESLATLEKALFAMYDI